MEYYEITTVVEGALDEVRHFTTWTAASDYIDTVEAAAKADGLETQVYKLYHPHAQGVECECIQFETDHHPYAEYNAKE
jgi:hypothetical protein